MNDWESSMKKHHLTESLMLADDECIYFDEKFR